MTSRLATNPSRAVTPRRLWRSGGIIVVILGGACRSGSPGSDADCMVESDRVEARAWLSSNPHPAPLAANRFGPRAAAEAFVDTLYALGADTVLALEVWEDEPNATYTASLVVVLPDDPADRSRLFRLVGREAVSEGFAPELDGGQRCLFLWWD